MFLSENRRRILVRVLPKYSFLILFAIQSAQINSELLGKFPFVILISKPSDRKKFSEINSSGKKNKIDLISDLLAQTLGLPISEGDVNAHRFTVSSRMCWCFAQSLQ